VKTRSSRRIKGVTYEKYQAPQFYYWTHQFYPFFTGIVMRANGLDGGNHVLGANILLGGIHWIWSILMCLPITALTHDPRTGLYGLFW
jgi:hypothetical protein